MVVNTASFRTIHYEQECCLRCEMEDECNFAVSVNGGRDCLIASSITPDELALIRTEDQATTQRFYIAGNTLNWCTVCQCDESSYAIDCRGKDLITLPSVYDEDWDVQRIDLSENSRLVVIGDELVAFGHSLKDIRLPRNLKHISPLSTARLPFLEHVTAEEMSDGSAVAKNFVTSAEVEFSDVCCSPKPFAGERSSTTELAVCNMTRDRVGDDTIYIPFMEYYFEPHESTKIRSSSPFMAEAAKNAEHCAEYCGISVDCQYFTFDTRVNNAGNMCILVSDKNADAQQRCCDKANYFADKGRTRPGFVSGMSPRARVSNDNARVIDVPIAALLDKDTAYQGLFDVSLGSMPMRGAVWVEPYLLSNSNVSLSFVPSRIVLYDSNVSHEVEVHVSGVERDSIETLIIGNKVTSCDKAFELILDEATHNVVMTVIGETAGSSRMVWIFSSTLVGVVVLGLIIVYVIIQNEKGKRLEDQVWKIDMKELHFSDPPVILGRGTFGLVLLAEFRGTEVAVKRVLPTDSMTKMPGPQETARCNDTGGDSEEALRSRAGSESGTGGSRLGTQYYKNGKFGATSVNAASVGASVDQLKQDFMEEMRILSMLRHYCVITVMGVVVDPKAEPMLVMERMNHGSLYDLLHNDTFVLEGELVLHILRDIAQGMRFLHASTPQILHRDLKCQNILVDGKFRAKVADFGLSQKARLGAVGSPFWMAPELLRGESSNSASSDIYSFGMILYEVYSRSDPYKDEDAHEVLRLVADPSVNKRPPLPATCPPKAQSIMTESLDKDPDRRPTFAELDLQLKRVDVSTIEPGAMEAKWRASKANKGEGDILYDMFPKHIAEAMREGRKIKAESRELVSIFFSDIIGFTTISSNMSAMKVSCMLSRLYGRFDRIADEHDIFKVGTIGDAYMAVTNLTKDQPDHAKRIAEFATSAIRATRDTLIDLEDPSKGFVEIRAGFHSGQVVASVVGSRNPRYVILGDAVNVASRMESTSEKNRIQCSERSASLLRVQCPSMELISRGLVQIKGKGEMFTYWVNEVTSDIGPAHAIDPTVTWAPLGISQRGFPSNKDPPQSGATNSAILTSM